MKPRWLLAPALAVALLAARPRHALPPLPDVVYGRYGPVPVKRVHAVDCPMPGNPDSKGVIGCYTASTRTIQIADSLSAEYAWWVLYHEEVQLGARDDGMAYTGPIEEAYASSVARYRLGERLAAEP